MQPDHVVPLICMWRESRSAPAAYEAVAWVILNRVADKRWPGTMTEVCLQPWQFSSFNIGDPNNTKMPSPKNAADWKSFQQACDALVKVLAIKSDLAAGVVMPIVDPTKGATHYHDHSISPPVTAWLGKAATLQDLLSKRTVTIGPFDFYRL